MCFMIPYDYYMSINSDKLIKIIIRIILSHDLCTFRYQLSKLVFKKLSLKVLHRKGFFSFLFKNNIELKCTLYT